MAILERDLDRPYSDRAMTRVGLYYRVSTVAQAEDGYGLDAQKRLLPEHCQRQGWKIAGEYEDVGIGGSFLWNRPGMVRLLEDIAAGKLDMVLAIEPSRFSRGNLGDWEFLKALCDEHGVTLATPSGPLYRPHSEDDDLRSDIEGVMSKAEKRRIQKRLQRGKLEATQQGAIISGTAPFGYRFQQTGKKRSEKRLVIQRAEAEVVRLIFRLMTEGIDGEQVGSLRTALHLSDVLKIPSATGGRWHTATVTRIVRNPVYIGEWAYRKTRPVTIAPERRKGDSTRMGVRVRPQAEWLTISDPEIVPPIVDRATWEAANRAVQFRVEHLRGRPGAKAKGLLVSFGKCSLCGGNLTHQQTSVKRATVHRYYVCTQRVWARVNGREPCPLPRWRAERLEEAVWGKLVEVIQSPELLRDLINASAGDLPPIEADEVGLIQEALQRNQAGAAAVKEALRRGAYSVDEFEEEIAKVRREREGLEERLARVQAGITARAEWEEGVSAALELTRAFRQLVEDPTPEQRRAVIEELVESVEVRPDGSFEIRWFPWGRAAGQEFSEMEQASTPSASWTGCSPTAPR